MITPQKRLKRALKSIFKSTIFLNLIGYIAFLYTYLVGKTGTYDNQEVKQNSTLLKEHNGGIFVSWHGRALMLPYIWHHPLPTYALASPHQDGRIIARLLNCYNIKTIDGSSDRNAARAALTITKTLNNGSIVCIISDGPRGPRMKLNKSVIYFAKKTGKPIIGITYSSQNAKVLQKTWDAMLLPKPFAKGYVATTKPIFVNKDATEEQMEQIRQSLEDELNALTFKLDKQCHVAPITIGVEKSKKPRHKKETPIC